MSQMPVTVSNEPVLGTGVPTIESPGSVGSVSVSSTFSASSFPLFVTVMV